MRITPALLESALGCTRERAALFAGALDEACLAYEITTAARLAHFLAQVGHESGALTHVREVWGPTPAQTRYEGRLDLGNTQPGDGRRYMGRGLLQTTGRSNHRVLRDRLRGKGIDAPDFEAAPELLEQPKWAAMSAADYWDMRNINRMADADDFEAITRAINGGINGLEDRRRRLERVRAVLNADDTSPQPVDKPAKPVHVDPRPDQEPYTQPEAAMPIPAIVGALLPTVIELLPRLGTLFGSGSKVSERNMAVAGAVLDLAQKTTGAVNSLDAVERMKADPVALAAVSSAVEANWFTLTEAGGGGIAGARAADKAAMTSNGPAWQVLLSPSFWAMLLLLPLVYMVVGSVAGLWGYADWSDDVRASLATAVVSLIVGGAAGYYWGTSTSRNRGTA